MLEFLKKNVFIIILSSITLFIGFLTFLTFIDRSFIELNQKNLQYLLISNIFLLFLLFIFIFVEINKSIKNDIDKDGLKSNKKFVTLREAENFAKKKINKKIYNWISAAAEDGFTSEINLKALKQIWI